MKKEHTSGRTRLYAGSACAGLCLLLLAGCAGAGEPPMALHYGVPCSPNDARNQLRQYFSTQHIPTGESAPDNKSFTITTADNINEPPSGKVDRRASYRVTIKPADSASANTNTNTNANGNTDASANSSIVDISRVSSKAKGKRERDWHDDNDAGALESEKQLTKAVEDLCRTGH
jgi:hypothetical protein